MAKLEQTSFQGNEVYLQLGSLAVLLTMVVTVLGIKFKWFKHRLSFEPIPNTELTGIGSVGSYRNSIDQSQLTQGVFRRRDEDENVIERPVSLPPVRVRKTSRGPPPPLLPQKRTVVPMPPGQELIPETPQIEPTTPPAFIPRSKRDKSPQKSPRVQIQEPLFEVSEEGKSEKTLNEYVERDRPISVSSTYEEIQVMRRPSSDILTEPEAPKRTKKLRPKSMEESNELETVPVHKPVRQKKASPGNISNENGFIFEVQGFEKAEQIEDQHHNAVEASATDHAKVDFPFIEDGIKTVHLETKESGDHENIFERRDASLPKSYFEVKNERAVDVDFEVFSNEKQKPIESRDLDSTRPDAADLIQRTAFDPEISQDKEGKSVHFDEKDKLQDRDHKFIRRDTGFSRPILQALLDDMESSVHFADEVGQEDKFVKRDSGYDRPLSEVLQNVKSVNFDVEEEPQEPEHKFIRRDLGSDKPNPEVLLDLSDKTVHFGEKEEHEGRKHKFIRRDTGFTIPDPEILQNDLDEEHQDREHKLIRRDTGFFKPNPEVLLDWSEKSVHFDEEEELEGREHKFIRRDTGFNRPDTEILQNVTESTVHFNLGEENQEREHKIIKKGTGLDRPTPEDLPDASEKSVHFDEKKDPQGKKHKFIRRDTGFTRPDPEILKDDFEHPDSITLNDKSVHFDVKEEPEKKEHKFERRDTGFVKPAPEILQEVTETANVIEKDLEQKDPYDGLQTATEKSVHFEVAREVSKTKDTGDTIKEIEEVRKTVTFEGVPDSPDDEYRKIISELQMTSVTSQNTDNGEIITAEEHERILEKKEIVPTVFLLEAEEMHNETEIDSLPNNENDKPKVVPAPRRSKERSTPEGDIKPICISFEEEEPQQIAFADVDTDDNEDSVELVEVKPDHQKPKIVDVKERPNYLEIKEQERPIPRQRSTTTATAPPPLPKTPPPVVSGSSNDNWTAIQIHRNLTKELNSEIMAAVLKRTAQKEVPTSQENLKVKEPQEEIEPPKNMRDMMRRRRDEYEFSGF